MPRFRCFFISDGDRVESIEPFETATDTEAVNRAHEMLRRSPQAAAVEIWESGHFVARIPRGMAKDRT